MYKLFIIIIYYWIDWNKNILNIFITGTAVNKQAAITSLSLFLIPTKCDSVPSATFNS